MPEELPTPPATITLYVPPWVRKYVIKRLVDKDLLFFDQRSRDLWDGLQRELRHRRLVEVVNDYDPETDRPMARLRLLVEVPAEHQVELTTRTHRFVVARLTKSCTTEMAQWVNWYHMGLRYTKRRALEAFRDNYGITEDDQSLESAIRMARRPRRPRRRRVNRSSSVQ